MASAAAGGGPVGAGDGVALGGPPLRRVEGEPQAVRGQRVYQHTARHGVDLGELLRTWQPTGRRGTS